MRKKGIRKQTSGKLRTYKLKNPPKGKKQRVKQVKTKQQQQKLPAKLQKHIPHHTTWGNSRWKGAKRYVSDIIINKAEDGIKHINGNKMVVQWRTVRTKT